MGFWGAAGAIGGAAIGSVTGIASSQIQADEAEASRKRALAAGQLGSQDIAAGASQATGYATQGQAAALDQYMLAQQYAQQQRAGLGQYYDQARQVGGSALQRYQDAILNGNNAGVYQDPAFAFRQQQAMGAAGQVAGNAGLGPGMLQGSDWARFNQGLAQSEYQNAMNRLGGLASMGAGATAAYAGADLSSLQAINQARGGYAAEANSGNQYLAQLTQNAAGAYANSLSNAASASSNYDIQRTNALMQGNAYVANAGAQGAQNLLYLYQRQNPQQAGAPPLDQPAGSRPVQDAYWS